MIWSVLIIAMCNAVGSLGSQRPEFGVPHVRAHLLHTKYKSK